MLTKKDYNELVRIINNSILDVAIRMSPQPPGDYEIKRVIWPKKFVDELCFWLRMDNPNFDESKFRAALNIGAPSERTERPQMTKRR